MKAVQERKLAILVKPAPLSRRRKGPLIIGPLWQSGSGRLKFFPLRSDSAMHAQKIEAITALARCNGKPVKDVERDIPQA